MKKYYIYLYIKKYIFNIKKLYANKITHILYLLFQYANIHIIDLSNLIRPK